MQLVRRSALVALASIELAVLLAVLIKPAYAYVDPGSGLLAMQMGGSMLAGALFVLRSRIRRILRLGSNEETIAAENKEQAEATK